MSDFLTRTFLDTPGKKSFFNFMTEQSGGWDAVMSRIDRGCTHVYVGGQQNYLKSIIDYDELVKTVLEEYDRPENRSKRHWPLEDKIKAHLKNRSSCLATQWRNKTSQIYNMMTNQPISSFVKDDTPKVKRESSIDRIQNVLEMCKDLTDGEKKVIIQSLQLSF